MHSIVGALKRYPWGSTDAIPQILGQEPDGTPWAEYWLGAHPDGSATDTAGERLDHSLHENPESLGDGSRTAFGDQLPFLLKLLSAASPLSIQAHPSREQAEVGHARENAAGMAPDSAQRSFRDDWPKPEIIIALGAFDALVGFREPAETARLLRMLGCAELAPVVSILASAEPTAEATREAFLTVFRLGTPEMVTALTAALASTQSADESEEHFRETARLITAAYPTDPSVLAALMLNRVRLQKWQALFVPAGTMHAYLQGDGVEVMGSSDNVVRGGLTAKHVDIPVLTEIGDFTPGTPLPLTPQTVAPGLLEYLTAAPEFKVWLVQSPEGTLHLPATDRARILLGLSGELDVTGSVRVRIGGGESWFVPAGEPVDVSGQGEVVLVSSGHDPKPTATPAQASLS